MSELTMGRYEIRGELGAGGMGTVYLAYDPTLGREVALKVLQPQLYLQDPQFSMRFEREARTVASLEHSSIVSLYDFGEDGEWLYLVMRLMEGGTLGDRLEQGPLSLEETIRIMRRLCSALRKAHRQGIVHRDLKPANILFDDDGKAFLSDFGIVKAADATGLKTGTGQALGTPQYMSPEQLEGMGLDGRSDIYSLGIILYEMLSGSRPYEAQSTARIIAMQLTAPVPSIVDANPGFAPELDAVIQKAMAKEPADRYATAAEMTEALGAIATKKSSNAAPVVAAGPKKGCLPSWIWWAGAAIVVLLLVFGIREMFGGGGDTAQDGSKEGSDVVGVIVSTATATKTPSPPTSTYTATATNTPKPPTSTSTATATNTPNPPTSTSTATATNTPKPPTSTSTATATNTPSPTATPDPNVRPSDAELGSVWERPRDQMAMLHVPPDTFPMGSEGEDGDEKPVHDVTLDGFWIDETEITNAQYRQCVDAGECQASIYDDDSIYNGDSFPVVGVSWHDADFYCEWVGGQLPTEAQWEYAARGREENRYPWGGGQPMCDLAQYGGCGGRTVPVGSYLEGASWVGALDMAGNVWEWVNDWYDGNYYANSPAENPAGPESGETKVLRGGSWGNPPDQLRSTHRPSLLGNPDSKTDSFGFRCAAPGG